MAAIDPEAVGRGASLIGSLAGLGATIIGVVKYRELRRDKKEKIRMAGEARFESLATKAQLEEHTRADAERARILTGDLAELATKEQLVLVRDDVKNLYRLHEELTQTMNSHHIAVLQAIAGIR